MLHLFWGGTFYFFVGHDVPEVAHGRLFKTISDGHDFACKHGFAERVDGYNREPEPRQGSLDV